MAKYFEPDDLLCLYCQKQYKVVLPFLKHVKRYHSGVYESLRESGRYDDEIRDLDWREICENPY